MKTRELIALKIGRPLLIDASLCENHSEYPRKFYIARNYSLWQTFLCKQYGTIFTHFHIGLVVSEREAENI